MSHGLLPWSLKPDITTVARVLAYVTGLVNQEPLLKNEYLLAESRILKAHLPPWFRLSRPERITLAKIGTRLGGNCCSTWNTRCLTRPCATSRVGRASNQHRRGAKQPTGRTSFGRHMDVLAGADFFSVDVPTWRGLVTYCVLFFIHLGSRRISITGI
jgi:hypothetical protein